MHSWGYLFASCLKLSNNLLIKEDWKHSTSDLAAWCLQGPCRPPAQPSAAAPVLLRGGEPNPRPAADAVGSLWPQRPPRQAVSVGRLSREMPFRLARRTADTLCVSALRADAARRRLCAGPGPRRLLGPTPGASVRGPSTAPPADCGREGSGNAPPSSGPGKRRGGPLPSSLPALALVSAVLTFKRYAKANRRDVHYLLLGYQTSSAIS